jgi:hypothetical protein
MNDHEIREAQAAIGQDEGLAFFFDLIKPKREDKGEIRILRDSLEKSASQWSVDRLKQALSLRDSYHRGSSTNLLGDPIEHQIPCSVGHIHYLAQQELAKRGIVQADPDALAKELARQLDTDTVTIWYRVIDQLTKLGPKAEPAIPALGRFYDKHYTQSREAKAVTTALEAIGGVAAWEMLRHVNTIANIHSPGNYTVCTQCETRMERVRGRGYQCPKCGRLKEDSYP